MILARNPTGFGRWDEWLEVVWNIKNRYKYLFASIKKIIIRKYIQN